MAEGRLREVEERLAAVPEGTLQIKSHTPEQDGPPLLEEAACPGGKGIVECWTVFPGIVFTYSLYRAGCRVVCPAPLGGVMRIDHCRVGRAGWETHGGLSCCLGPGDISVCMTDGRAESVISFPLGCYEGFAVTVDPDTLDREPPELLREAGVSGRQLRKKFGGQDGCTVMPANPRIECIFSQLYGLPPRLRLPYFKLKAQELLLFLSMPEPARDKRPDQYASQQIEIIQSVHRQLTGHLDRRFTIEELSKQYLINTSSLKAAFKRVYGLPIAAYMKEYRMRKAAELLRETEDSIAEIAAQTGYQNQSKFTAAFRELFQMPPTAYRRQRQK